MFFCVLPESIVHVTPTLQSLNADSFIIIISLFVKCIERLEKVFSKKTEGGSDMTENTDITDHPWPYMKEMFQIVAVKKD